METNISRSIKFTFTFKIIIVTTTYCFKQIAMPNLKIKISIFLNYFLFAVLLNSVGIVILQVQHFFAVTESSASVLEAFKDISIAVVSFLTGSFITRIGYKKAMLLALACVAVFCFVLPLVKTFTAVRLLFAVSGAGFGLTKVSVFGIIGLITKNEREHISFMNFIESFFMVGVLSGYFIFGYFIDDKNPLSPAWFNVYYVIGTLSCLAFLLLLSSPLEEKGTSDNIPTSRISTGFASILLPLMIKPMVISFIICAFLYVLIEQSIMSWLPTFNNKVLHLTSSVSVLMASILAAFTAIGRFVAGILFKKIHWYTVLVSCLAASAVLILIALPLARETVGKSFILIFGLPTAAYIIPVIGLFLAPIYPAINSVILASLPKRMQGSMSGLIVVFSALGGTLGSIITGYIFQHYGGEAAFYFSLVPLVFLIISLYIYNKIEHNATISGNSINNNRLLHIEDFEELFTDVQMKHVFSDQKIFPDAVPNSSAGEILEEYRIVKHHADFNLKRFTETHFNIPHYNKHLLKQEASSSPKQHIEGLWNVLTRKTGNEFDTLIPLPKSFIVPGGRFRETFYWDTYFTMLGLQESGKIDLIEGMVDNFAYLIDTFGFIPNGNRTYFLSRSQPPFFALMVELLSEEKCPEILLRYLPQLEKEYQFWMRSTDMLTMQHPAEEHAVLLNDNEVLNRYWDALDTPRPESYAIDITIAGTDGHNELFRHIRAACESGWDFSGRWLNDQKNITSIHTTDIIPVDLNCLLYKLETVIATAYELSGNKRVQTWYEKQAKKRKVNIQKYFWDTEAGIYFDYNYITNQPTGVRSMASAFPLFFNIAEPAQAASVLEDLEKNFLQPGGLLTTLIDTGQQWDYPNGWAPLQWVGYVAALNYGYASLAEKIRDNWLRNIETAYEVQGKLMEKYNVTDMTATASGGEYENQEGFGWTNGVYLKMLTTKPFIQCIK